MKQETRLARATTEREYAVAIEKAAIAYVRYETLEKRYTRERSERAAKLSNEAENALEVAEGVVFTKRDAYADALTAYYREMLADGDLDLND